MNTTTNTSEPTVEAIATNDKVARLYILLNRLENLTAIENRLKDWDGPWSEKLVEFRKIEADRSKTRQEIIALATR